MVLVTLSLVTLLAAGSATKKCRNATVPVTVSARTAIFGNVNVPKTNSEATGFILALTPQGGNLSVQALTEEAMIREDAAGARGVERARGEECVAKGQV